MKRIIILAACCSFFLFANAQADSSKIRYTEPSDSTALGIPNGKIVSKQIGPTGGTIMSEDGRIELIFPTGALTATTTISIQPTTNLAPNGAGKAYQFEPSGIQFKEPVQINFHYTDDEAETCPPELMAFAMQSHTGKWSFTDYEDWDSTTKTLKGFIHHFSYFTDIDMMSLDPGDKELGVNAKTIITVSDLSKFLPTGDTAFATLGKQGIWYVNEIRNGNSTVGTLSPSDVPLPEGGKTVYAFFTAPQYLPIKNPASIKLTIQYYSRKLKKKAWGSLRCHIGVYDAYRVQVIHEFTARVGSQLIDSASFDVWLYPTHAKKIEITDIKNYPPKVLHEGRKPPFREKIFTEDAPGSIDITNTIKSDSLSKDYPPEVYFEFTPKEILLYKFEVVARGTSSGIEPLFSLSIPAEISFIANGQVQRYNSDMNNVTATEKNYKVIVTPRRSD